MIKNKKSLIIITSILFLFMGCSSEQNYEFGTIEWCDSVKNKKESDLTIKEKEEFENCLAIYRSELLIGIWEKTNTDQFNELIDDDERKQEKYLIEYKKDGSGVITFYYEEPTKYNENPRLVEFEYEVINQGSEVRLKFGSDFEYSEILELSENRFVDKGKDINVDISHLPTSEYKKVTPE